MAVSVVGFDVGCLTSYIAVAKTGGIETLINEYSDRQTPTCVAFAEHRRFIGTAAKMQHVTNISNTVVNFLPLLGKKLNDSVVLDERQHLPYRIEEAPDGRVSIRVNYNGSAHNFSPEQILAMQLTKLKNITETAMSSKVVDVVINVPAYYTDSERRAMLDASQIAGLNCVKLVNDTTAIGIAYGLYNKDLPVAEQPPKVVAFVSVGYTSTQIAICAFNLGEMKVLATACDPTLGGRNFDRVIFRQLAMEFDAKYNMKVEDSPKAFVRLFQECEKLKKQMSANTQELPINIDCLLNDRDLISKMKRADFEHYGDDLLSRFQKVLLHCLELAKLQPSDVHTVEMVGGSSRIPALRNIASSVFKQDCRTTLNADEAVARGCALQAAILSPSYKVRDFKVIEACPYGITLHWDNDDSGGKNVPSIAETDGGMDIEGRETSMEVFPVLYPIPCTRQLSFNRRGPFTLEARYSNPEALPNQNVLIGSFHVSDVPQGSGEASKIRVVVRMNAHGIFSVSKASIAEEYEKEVITEVPDETATENDLVDGEIPDNGDMPNDEKVDGPEATNVKTVKKPAMKKKVEKKKMVKYVDLPVCASIMQFSLKQLDDFREVEGQLNSQDDMEHHRSHAKNAVEEYVYEMRSNLQGPLHSFATPKEAEDFCLSLDETENWLYGDGENLQRQAYMDRLNQLRTIGDKLQLRCYEFQNQPSAVQCFESCIVRIRKVFDSIAAGEDTFSHLTPAQLNTLKNSVDEQEGWLRGQLRKQSDRLPTEDPILRCAEIVQHQQTLESVCGPIINTPKPAPPPPPPETKPNGVSSKEKNTESTPLATETGKKVKSPKVNPTVTEKNENMDID